MPRSSKKTQSPGPEHKDKKISIRTDIDPATVLDPTSETAIKMELTRLKESRKKGDPKPKDVSWGDWMGPTTMKPQHYVFASLVAMGMPLGQIALECKLSPGRVSILFQNSLVKAYSTALRGYYTSDVKRRFEALVPKAVGAYEKVLDENYQGADKLQVDVASRILDRQWGPSKKDVQDAGSVALSLLRALKDVQTPPVAPEPILVEGRVLSPGGKSPALFREETTDDGSVSGLLNSWEERNNETNGKEDESEEAGAEPSES